MSYLMIFNQRGRFQRHRILTEFSISAKLEKLFNGSPVSDPDPKTGQRQALYDK
jgi:hypothetical protein